MNDPVLIHGIDNLSYGYKERLPKNGSKFQFYEIDIFQISQSFKTNETYDILIHCSAIAPLPDCQANPENAITQNITQCATVVEFCRRNGIKNIIFF